MFEAHGLTITINEEIKILALLKNSNGIHFKTIHIDNIPYYAILAKVRDFQKRVFTTNIDGTLDITEQGMEYLNQLLKSI
jgi:hypothetical protein